MERWQRKYGIVPENTSSAGCTAKDWPLRMLSAKDIQRLVGVFVWDCRVRREDVSSVLQEIVGIQYRACRADNPTAPSQAEVAVLKLRWKKFQRNTLQTWREGVPPPVRSARCILVSDASGGPLGRWSFCEMISGRVERDGKGPVNPSGVFEPGVPEPIYYREAHGVLLALRRLAFQGRRQLEVIIVSDSAAVFGSRTKRLVPHRALKTFIEIRKLCSEMEWTLVPKWVESLGNVCDSGTHTDEQGNPLPICWVREARSWEVAMSSSYLTPGKNQAKRPREE